MGVFLLLPLRLVEEVLSLGYIVLFVISIGTAGPYVESVGLAETGPLCSCSTLGFDGSLFVLIGCLGLLEYVDDVLALVDFVSCQRLPEIEHMATRALCKLAGFERRQK